MNLSRRVLFGGYYGQENVGDDSFGVISTWGARHFWKTKQPLLLSSKEILGPVNTTSVLRKKNLFRGQSICESFWQMLCASSVVWSGGSIFHSKGFYFSTKTLSFYLSKIGITPVGAIGVSLGPYKTSKDQIEVYSQLKKLHFLVLRDQKSYDEALTLDLPYRPVLGADLAMLLPKVAPEFKSKKNFDKVLGITVCHYERYVKKDIKNEKRREKVILESILTLAQKVKDIVFRLFIFNNHPIYGDKDITLEIYNKLVGVGARVEVIPYSADPISIWKKVAECNAMISTRLHGGIFSAAANIPCFLIEYHRKCTDFLMDVGVDKQWVIGDANSSPRIIAKSLLQLIEEKPSNFFRKRESLIERAEKNFTFHI